MSEEYFRRNHAHQGLDVDGSKPVDFDDIAGTLSLEDSRIADIVGHATARNIAFDCLAGNDTVTYRAGMALKLWDGTRWRTRVLAVDTDVNDAADSNTKYPYAYYTAATDAIAFEHSTTAPTWSAADGFWISGTDRTRRWLGCMMPKSSTTVMYAFEVRPQGDGRAVIDFTPRTATGISIRTGALAANTMATLAITSYHPAGLNLLSSVWYALATFSPATGGTLTMTATNATGGRALAISAVVAVAPATIGATLETHSNLATVYFYVNQAITANTMALLRCIFAV